MTNQINKAEFKLNDKQTANDRSPMSSSLGPYRTCPLSCHANSLLGITLKPCWLAGDNHTQISPCWWSSHPQSSAPAAQDGSDGRSRKGRCRGWRAGTTPRPGSWAASLRGPGCESCSVWTPPAGHHGIYKERPHLAWQYYPNKTLALTMHSYSTYVGKI